MLSDPTPSTLAHHKTIPPYPASPGFPLEALSKLSLINPTGRKKKLDGKYLDSLR